MVTELTPEFIAQFTSEGISNAKDLRTIADYVLASSNNQKHFMKHDDVLFFATSKVSELTSTNIVEARRLLDEEVEKLKKSRLKNNQ